MTDLRGARVVVAGAGVIGTACALAFARAGAEVILTDPAPDGVNASSIAAGMLAPAFEALDPACQGQFDLLRHARNLWPAFIESLAGVELNTEGAQFTGSDVEVEAKLAALLAVGARAERTGERLFTPDDWRIEPAPALAAMHRSLIGMGASRLGLSVQTLPRGDILVLACGFGGQGLAPELDVLAPIKGQLVRFEGGPRAGPVLRGPGGYVVPSAYGAIAGATMAFGVSDTVVEDSVTRSLRVIAGELSPGLDVMPALGRAGVRAATPDGLPMVGASSESGVWIAAGARRNGWLLAPLIARLIVEGVAGGPGDGEGGGSLSARLAAGRFLAAQGEAPSPSLG